MLGSKPQENLVFFLIFPVLSIFLNTSFYKKEIAYKGL